MYKKIENISICQNKRTKDVFDVIYPCDFCGSKYYHTYTIFLRFDDDTTVSFCKSCLQNMIDMMNNRYLDDCNVDKRRKD